MPDTPSTVFRFAAEGVDLEFAGSENFVEKQLERFQSFLRGAAGGAQAAAPVVHAPVGHAPVGHAPVGHAPVGQALSTPAAPTEAPSASAASTGSKETVAEFYKARPVREGRGAIQDRILLFIYFLQNAQGKRDVSGDDILWCHQQAGVPEPKNLHNALGILKRKVGYLQEGTKRGLYGLSAEGKSYIEGRFSGR